LTGVFAVEGAVYCTHPILIYTGGSIGMGLWCASTLTSMILGINRCCELYGSFFAEKVFGGRRLWFWVAPPLVFMVYMTMWSTAPLFSPLMMAWVGRGECWVAFFLSFLRIEVQSLLKINVNLSIRRGLK
jgi:hypothetical protein